MQQYRKKRERLKSELHLRLKKRKVQKIVKEGPFGLLKIQFVAKYQTRAAKAVKEST